MKKKLLFFVIIVLCLTGCYKFDTEEYIKKELDINVSTCQIKEEIDSHGGFHGDGETLIKFDCSENSNVMLEQIHDWESLPLTENLQLIMYGGVRDGVTYGYELAKQQNIPEIANGYYYFIDRHSGAQNIRSDKHLFDRYSFNFTLALYDIDTNLMYYYEFDT